VVAVLLLRMILDHGTVDACAGGVTLRLSRVLGSPSGPGSRRARLRHGAHTHRSLRFCATADARRELSDCEREGYDASASTLYVG
jgi:hypothetical protein